MTRKTPAARIALTASLVALALAAVPVAFAGKGGPGGGSGGNGTTTSAKIAPSCNPCAAATVVQFTGSGFNGSQASAQVYFKSADGTTTGAAIPVNPDGTISFSWFVTGTRDVTVYQQGGGHKWVLKAETMVYVQ